ncbi:MAG: beta-propeller fold lactonase family protein [Candidatus Acidiferrum sp.]
MSLVAGGGTGCPNQTEALGDNCPATQATLSAPWGLYVDSAGDIFIADYNNSRIREVVASTGIIQSIAGTGVDGYNGDNIPANTAQIANPTGLYGDSAGNIYFSDLENFRIREIVASTRFIQTAAGTGTPGYNGDNILATSADILGPFGLFVDLGGNIFFGDTGNFLIREVVASTGVIQTVGGNGTPGFTGDGGLATSGSIGYVYGLSGDTNGDLLLADTYANRVREIYGIVPADTLTITTSTLPLASVGTPYSFSLQAIDGTAPYTWSLISGSPPPGFSSLSSSGVITGVPTTVGTTTFSVQVNDSANHVQTRTLSLVVTPEGVTLQSIVVAPVNPTVAINATQPFQAVGTYNDGSTQNLSAAVTWSSGTATAATISAAGIATGVSAGTSLITATLGAVTGSTTLTVTATAPHLYVGSAVSANCCLDVLDTATNQVIKSIPTTALDEPFGISPDQSRIYIADNVNNLVDVVDTTTNTLVTTIPVGPGATSVAITPNGQFGYVAEYGDSNVSVFSLATNTLVATIPIGFVGNWDMATPDGAFVYVTSSVDNRVAVISTSTNTLTSTFTITPPSGQPASTCLGGPRFNPAGTLGYIVQACLTNSPGSITVLSIPSNAQLATITVGTFPYDLVLSPDGSRLYIPNEGSNNVSVIDTSSNTVIATIPVGNAPQSISITPDGTLVYVANTQDSTLSIIQTSTNTVSATVPLTTPFGMVFASPPPASQATTLALTPPNLIFTAPLGSPTSQTIKVTNPGTPSVSLTSIALTGPNVADYRISSNTCPQPPNTLAGNGGNCSLQVVFTPLATGSLTAFVTITSTNGLASSTQSAPLAGTGNPLVAAFSNLTPSQSIFAGTSSITLAGTIGSGTTFPTPGETISISINGASQTVTIGSNGTFSTAFSTANIPASPTPYVITYSYAGDANFGAATDSSTTLTVNPVVSSFQLTVTDIGTGNGAVTDNLQQIDCITTAGVQSGTCSASYSAGTPVTLTATPSGNTTFAAWGGACSGTTTCAVTMNSAQSVTASFTPPPQQISLTFSAGTTVSGMATYDCPSNPNPTPTNPCTDPNAHALALSIPQVLVPFTVTVQASEVPPSVANGICPNGDTPTQDFDCRFVTFFTYQTNANGDKVVPLCYPYANGNCVHYQVYSGTPGVEPDPSNYVGPIDWEVSWNNDAFVPPAPYTGSIPQLYDDPDYAVTPTSPYGTDCTTPMLVNGSPTNPPIYCQFEFNITTAYLPDKKVDAGITGRTKQFNDVAVAFPPANVGNLTITDAPLSATVVAGSPIGYTITVTNSAGGAVTGATLTDALPAGTNVNWTISPTYSGPGTCAITGSTGAQVLSCSFGTITASQTFTVGLLSPTSSIGTYTDTTTTVFGTQQILSIATLAAQGITATFSNITPSQTIQAGTASITLSGAIGNGEQFPVGNHRQCRSVQHNIPDHCARSIQHAVSDHLHLCGRRHIHSRHQQQHRQRYCHRQSAADRLHHHCRSAKRHLLGKLHRRHARNAHCHAQW